MSEWQCPECGLINNLEGSVNCFCGYKKILICDACNKEVMALNKSNHLDICNYCLKYVQACSVCGCKVLCKNLYNNAPICGSCFEYIMGLESDHRIVKLINESAIASTNNTLDDFDALGNEALSDVKHAINYEILGLPQNSSLSEVKDKIKELLKTWHPDLHKQDQDKYKQAVEKVSELKLAYDAIVTKINAPYLPLELKYGASQNEIIQAYENLKIIYNPTIYDYNPMLQDKIKLKLDEVTNAYEYLMMVNPRTQDSAMRPQEQMTPQTNPPSQSQTTSIDIEPQVKPSFAPTNQDSGQAEITPEPQVSIATNTGNSTYPKGRTIKTIGTILTVICLLLAFVFAKGIGKMAGKSAVQNFNQGKLDGTIENILLETSKQINSQLPSMVDKETRLDTTMCAGKNMQYKYTMVNIAENELDKTAFNNEMRSMLVKNQCSNDNMIKMLKMGVSYNYMYQDKNGALIATVNISRADCGL